ncbi:hypothetical protein BH10PSE19_BH10PSE19_13340 [soil metagenome]
MYTLFTAHLRKVHETYTEHFVIAASIGIQMIAAGAACVVHAVFPFLFESTGSDMLFKLAAMITQRRNQAENATKPNEI